MDLLICSYSRLSFQPNHWITFLSWFAHSFLSKPLSFCLNVLFTPGTTPFVFSLEAIGCLSSSVVVEMFCHGWPPGGWRGTLRISVRLTRGGKLQSHFILIAEWGAWALAVFFLCQLFSATWWCVRDFISPMEERIIHLKRKNTKNVQYMFNL